MFSRSPASSSTSPPAGRWRMGHFLTAGVIMIVANIFDFIDGKVAHGDRRSVSKFGGFWDSVIDRFSDLALSVGLICLYSSLGRTDYVLITSIAMVFATMTSYTRARAESLHPEVQGRLHGAARAHRAVHDRRVHQPHGRRDVGDRRAVDRDGRQPHPLHVSRAERPAAAARQRPRAASSSARSTGPTSARRSPTTSGSSRSWRSSGSRRPTGSAIRWRSASRGLVQWIIQTVVG